MNQTSIGLLCCSLLIATEVVADNPTFVNVASLNEEHGFWKEVKRFQQAVAEDLGITTLWIYADNDQNYARTAYRSYLEQHTVDASLLVNFKMQGDPLIQLTQKIYPVPSITYVNTADANRSGKPREKYSSWVGEIFIDEEYVGYILARQLIMEALDKRVLSKDGILEMIAMSGHQADTLAHKRQKGLLKAVKEYEAKVVLRQIIPVKSWASEESATMASRVFTRYPEAKIYWAANDEIALGIIRAAKKNNKIPGKDIIIGGIDWMPEALEAIDNGTLCCSIGGLFSHGGFATILLYDYINGHDFVDSDGLYIETKPVVANQKNVHKYIQLMNTDWREIDFREFSKTYNQNLKHYDFSLEKLSP